MTPHKACGCPACVRAFVDVCYEVIFQNYQPPEPPRQYDERFAMHGVRPA